ncbi:MAG: Na(+)-translocating NADH-quinone reductase subunit A [Eudoraea sp.]|nr:Na(+)-translocating NADH-quinone reductase subunit A [Eudoraea sp.]
MIVVVAIVLIGILVQLADSLLGVEAKKQGVSRSSDISLFAPLAKMFGPKLPDYVAGSEMPVHVLSKGHDIKLEGEADKQITAAGDVTRYAIQPRNFIGISPIPKLTVEVGDEVKAGQPIMFDKKRPDIMHVAPVSGEVIELNRAEKRAISEVVILADKDQRYHPLNVPDLDNVSREDLVQFLLSSGGWPLINQRPYDIMPEAGDIPADIFISTFDSAPLAPDANLIAETAPEALQVGINVLNKLTEGKVYIGLDARKGNQPTSAIMKLEGVEKHWFSGPHPSGNVGIQIHHIKPISTTAKVWTIDLQCLIILGRIFTEGRYNSSKVVVLAGSQVKTPKYVSTYQGAHIGELLKDNLKEGKSRMISGDVLSGKPKSDSSYLNFHDDQVTVIKEGDYYKMFGWLIPSLGTPSINKSLPSAYMPNLKFEGDTNTHGEQRAFVMTGEYESVLPMDIYPQHLMKAILANNFEEMEGLGIYELSEEDLALCEFACTSKVPLQSILRQGLELMREQG